MRKLVYLFVFLLSFFLLVKPVESASFTCNVSVSPILGTIGETRFSISGNVSRDVAIIAGGLVPNQRDFLGNRPQPLTTWSMAVQNKTFSHSTAFSNVNPGSYVVGVYEYTAGGLSGPVCETAVVTLQKGETAIVEECSPSSCNTQGSIEPSKWTCDNPKCEPKIETGRTGTSCTCVPKTVERKPIEGPVVGGYEPTYCDPEKTEIQTALGCIPINKPENFIAWFLRWAIGIAGGIAFLLILFAGFQIITSSGDPEKLKAGKELLTSAIAGLILIIFSLFLLRLIGIQILRIPGLQ